MVQLTPFAALLCGPNSLFLSRELRGLQDAIAKFQEEHEKEREAFRLKYLSSQKQAQETIDHLQKKCVCLTKL